MRKSFHLGFDYYPEQWPEEQWPEDLRLMRECGTTAVRIAEFAWSRMEPQEGRFEFDWLDRFFSLAEQHGIAIILGTPTAAPPPWAWQTYPDVALMEEDGQRHATTSRRFNCPTSPNGLRLCDRIVERMAKRYGRHRQLIGWQTDNEFGGAVCFCEHCQGSFREWLKARHGTVEAFNKALGLVFWAHEVTDWGQVVLPRRGMDRAHPSVRLETHRFFSHAWSQFARRQTELIHRSSPGRWVTHNLPGFGIKIDLFELAEAHDFLSIDMYPKAMIDPPFRVGFANSITHGAQKRAHWVMELQSGTPCTKFYKAPIPREGQLRLWAHQSAAHGAEGVVFFRWRKSPVGQEMFGNGLLDHDSRPRRQYREIQQLGSDFARLAEILPERRAEPEAALVYDFSDRINADIHAFAMDVDYWPHLTEWWAALRRLGINVRFVRPTDDLAPYRLVLAPNQFTTSPEIVENFATYVRRGGTLVGALRMGFFDVHGKPACQTLPGGLTELFGAEVEEYERVMAPNPNRVVFEKEIGPPAECRNWNYVLNGLGAAALGVYERDYYAGKPAATCNDFGQGRAVYIGTMLASEALDRLFAHLCRLAGLALIPRDWPQDVELVRLKGPKGERVWAALNHAQDRRRIVLPQAALDLVGGESAREFDLAPLSARWLRF